MQFQATITKALPETSGVSAKTGNTWRKATYEATYDNSKPEWPKAVAINVMGDNIDKFNLRVGGSYLLRVDFTTREWQGKLIMDAVCYDAVAIKPEQAPAT